MVGLKSISPKLIDRNSALISDLLAGCFPKVWNHFPGYTLPATAKSIIFLLIFKRYTMRSNHAVYSNINY